LTTRAGVALLVLSATAAVFLGLVRAHPGMRRTPVPLHVAIHPAQVVANGYDTATLEIESPSPAVPHVTFLENLRAATVQDVSFRTDRWVAQIRAGVVPGRVGVRVEVAGLAAAVTELNLTADHTDTAGDGTPDVLRLEDDHDRRAFRSWFTFLAEAQYFQPPEARPAEIVDCAALIRYAYREALRGHDSGWAAEVRLPLLPGLEPVAKYQYPFTPLGPALFRVREGPFRASDLTAAAFAQFADAQTLQRFNSHRVARRLAQALPGDLLFFRQESDHMPFHSMIYLGPSQITRADGAHYVVYHTGPEGADPGIMRRLTTEDLLHYPEPQWRPVENNPRFLGVYRWNILRETP
jgi:hypothetical protein